MSQPKKSAFIQLMLVLKGEQCPAFSSLNDDQRVRLQVLVESNNATKEEEAHQLSQVPFLVQM